MPPAAPKSAAPVLLVYGEDEFAVKQRARQVYQQWTEELGGMDPLQRGLDPRTPEFGVAS